VRSADDLAYSVALQPDGRIVVAGPSDEAGAWDFAVVRYNADGGLDASFSGDGKLTTAMGPAEDYANSVALQSDGKIVVAGYSYIGTDGDFAVARYEGGTPEITVLGNGYSIADGDTTPSATDWTDFGSVVQGGTAILRAFTVGNSGTATLTLGAVSVPVGYTLTEALSTNLAPGASDTFTVRLDTVTAGHESRGHLVHDQTTAMRIRSTSPSRAW